MKKMLKQFGYTNIALLIVGIAIILTYVDFQNPKIFDYVLLTLYGVTVLIHLARLILFMFQKER